MKKIGMILYVNILVPVVLCILLPLWNLRAEQQFQNDLLIARMTNVRNISELIVAVVLAVMTLVYLDKIESKFLYISFIIMVVWILIWFYVKPFKSLYAYGCRWLMAVLGTDIVILFYRFIRRNTKFGKI